MDADENDLHDGSFEEESFVNESFDTNEVFRKAKDNFSNIIDKYICLIHGLASPAFIADHGIEMSVPKRLSGRKIFVENSQNINSEQTTPDESLECENSFQEEIERTLLRRKQELGLPDDYVPEELPLCDDIKVSDIGLEDGNNTGMRYAQEADKKLQEKRGWRKTKPAIYEEGKQEMEGTTKEKGVNRKQKKKKDLQEQKPRGRPRGSTLSEIEKQEVEGEIKMKKSRGRPRKSTSSDMNKQETEGETKAKKPRGRPRGSASSEIEKQVVGEFEVKKTCGRPRNFTSFKMSKQEAEGEPEAKKPRGRPRKFTASEIGKQEIYTDTKIKKPCGRPKKSSTSEVYNKKRKKELLKKIKESFEKPIQSTGHEVNKNKAEKKSRLSKINVSESDKYETEQELREDYGKPNMARYERPKALKRKRGRPKKEKLKSSKFHSRQNKKINTHQCSFSELYAKSSQKYKGSSNDFHRPFRVDGMKNTVARKAKSADNNGESFCNKSVSRYFKHLVTFGVNREQGHISLCPNLDLIIVHPLKKDDCLGVSSFPLPRKVLFAIPFASKSTVSEKDIDETVAQKSRSDCTLKATSGDSVNDYASSKVPYIKEKVTNRRSSLKNSCHGLSNVDLIESHGEHSCKHQKLLKYKRNLSNIKRPVSDNEISEKSQNVNLKDDLQPVVESEYQLKDKGPQDNGHIDTCKQFSLIQKSKDTRLLENEKVLHSNENSNSGKDGAQMVSKMEKVLLGQNYGDPTKQKEQKSKEKHGLSSENLVNDGNHNEKELDLSTTHVSAVVESANNNRNAEQCLSPEAYVRRGKRQKKFKESRSLRCSKRNKLEASLYPSTSFTGPAKSRKLDSKKRERKLSSSSPPNKDCSNGMNRSLADVFQYSDVESSCEDSLNLVSKDCQSAFIDGKMPKAAKEYVVSDCIKTDEHTKVKVFNSCPRNSRRELRKSFRNEESSLKLNTDIENNSRIVAQDLKNDSNKESTSSRTSLPEKDSGSGKRKEFPVVEGNHEESVVAGIDVVKKKRINIVARNKVTVHSKQYISSIMPGEETCPSNLNSCAAEPMENGVLDSVSAGFHMQEAILKKMPKKDMMSQLQAEDEDSDGFQDSLSLLPVEKSSVSVGLCHSSLFHFRRLRKLLPQNVSKCVGESVSLHPENNASTGANFTGKSTSVQSKVPSFFDISDDEDHLMDLPSSVEADCILEMPSRVKSSFSKNRSIGFSFQKKGSKQVSQQHNFMYKGKVVDIMKFL